MKSKRDCLIGQDVKRQLTQRYREIGIPNTDSSDFLSAAVPRSGKQAEALAMRQPSDESPVTVVVADDHLVILEGLIKILNSQKDIRVVASAADGQEVSKLYYQFLPDVLMLDLRLPKKDGLQVLNELMARVNPKPRVVIITTFDCEQAIFQAVRAGAKAFLVKAADPQEIREAVRRVAKGETFFPSEIGLKLAKSISSPRLSKREMEVLESLASGKNNREIGHALDIGEGTIKFHVKSILRKLDVIGRAEALAVATRRGIIELA
ncbi:MAG TPA: response regulator transcription factor [Chthoniobacterales bacterium]|nr:response regulator transcription factor [Chthoniobacterales bacterium]